MTSTAASSVLSHRAVRPPVNRIAARDPICTPTTAAAAGTGASCPWPKWIDGAGGGGDAIMNALVAAAARTGTPHHAFSTGTLITPPPMPSGDETFPATNEAASAAGIRRTRYNTMPPLSSS